MVYICPKCNDCHVYYTSKNINCRCGYSKTVTHDPPAPDYRLQDLKRIKKTLDKMKINLLSDAVTGEMWQYTIENINKREGPIERKSLFCPQPWNEKYWEEKHYFSYIRLGFVNASSRSRKRLSEALL